MTDVPETESPSANNRRVIHATCKRHGGAIGYTNLVVSKHGGRIELDPHVSGQCVITLEEDATRVLYELLGAWLG